MEKKSWPLGFEHENRAYYFTHQSQDPTTDANNWNYKLSPIL